MQIGLYFLATILLMWHNLLPHQHRLSFAPAIEEEAHSSWYEALQEVIALDIGQDHLQYLQSSSLHDNCEDNKFSIALFFQGSLIDVKLSQFLAENRPLIYTPPNRLSTYLVSSQSLRAPPNK